jgi:hypothetical protein
VCLVQANGAIRVICSVCELAPSRPEIRRGDGGFHALLKELSLESLLCILGTDHGYRRGFHRPGFVDYDPQRVADISIMATDTQFGAAFFATSTAAPLIL